MAPSSPGQPSRPAGSCYAMGGRRECATSYAGNGVELSLGAATVSGGIVGVALLRPPWRDEAGPQEVGYTALPWNGKS